MGKVARPQVVLVTGSSSGIGNAICELLASSGSCVYGGSRTRFAGRDWTHLPLDVTDTLSVEIAVARVLENEGRLDALVTCAGHGFAGPMESASDEEVRSHFEANVLGTTRMIRAVLPSMRVQKSGRIIVIGSIGGLIGLPFISYYSAAKVALDGLVEALRFEIRPFGIQATIVHPGKAKTGFCSRRAHARNGSIAATYEPAYSRTLDFYEQQEENAGPPDAVAHAVQKLLKRRSLPVRVVTGTPLERLGVIGKRALGGRAFEYLMHKAYAPARD